VIEDGVVVLKDGSSARLRAVVPADRPALEAFLRSLSLNAVYTRFNSLAIDLGAAAARWAEPGVEAYGIVAIDGPECRIVAHAEYVRIDPRSAEVSFTTAEGHRGLGLATLLLADLAMHARARGIQTFEAFVLPDNRRMAEVLRESGFAAASAPREGFQCWRLATDLTSAALDQYDLREAVALRTSMQRLLSPRNVAVIGASRTRGTIGAEIFHNLLATSFNGAVYPVNRGAEVVQSVRSYKSVGEIPGPVDLAVIVVPSAHVLEVASECATKGVAALVVISAGFAEAGVEGVARQRELVRVCRESGMRLVGPNCMGVINTDPNVCLNATFAPTYPPPGRVGFLSQSGALGLAVIDHAVQRGIGLSSFVSVGNKADVSGNDLLSYWEGDARTDVALLYLESFGNPRKFARIARRVGRTKPIVAVKSGRSVAGARATASHTGALVAASDVTTDALFRQTGVHSWDTVWAEDGKYFFNGTNSVGDLFHQYAGYLQLTGRSFGLGAHLVPIDDVAIFYAVGGAALTSLMAAAVWYFSEQLVMSRVLRVVLALQVVVLPAMLLEQVANGVNAMWAVLYAGWWALVYRPRHTVGVVGASLVAALAVCSSSLALVFVPLAAVQAPTAAVLRAVDAQ